MAADVPEVDTPATQEEESHELENQTNLSDGYILLRSSDSESTEALEVEPSDTYASTTMSYHISVLLALGIIAGVLVFNLLSPKRTS